MTSAGSSLKKGLFWSLSERVATKASQFILQVVLARLLVPDDYGVCVLLLAFVNVAMIFIDSGFSSALVQKKDIKSVDFSSVFHLSIFISILIYIALFISAPEIATFYNDGRITNLLRVVSLSLIIGAYNSVQTAILRKKLLFKFLFTSNVSGIVISAIVSIYMAFAGYGAWAIVMQYLVNRIVITITLCIQIKWFPRLEFSYQRVKVLFNFGWKVLATNFLSTIVTNLYSAVIGKAFTKAELGLYDTGNKISSAISDTFISSLSNVLFPVFSKIQDDRDSIKRYIRETNVGSTFIMFPLMFGLAACSYPIVEIVLTHKWIDAVPFMQMSCLLYASYPLHIANIQALNAIGRSDVALKNEIQKKTLDVIFLFLTIHFSLYWVAFGRVVTSVIALYINMKPNTKFLNYSMLEQLRDVVRNFIISMISAVLMYAVYIVYKDNMIILLTIQIILGITSYLLLSYLFNKALLVIVKDNVTIAANRIKNHINHA